MEIAVPSEIDGMKVLEFTYFEHPLLPLGYSPPQRKGKILQPVENVAICRADALDGYYTIFCSSAWQHVAFEFNETLEAARRAPAVEFGVHNLKWRRHVAN